MTRDEIIAEIRRTAEANGGVPVGKAKFFEATGIKESDWAGRIWVRWSDAVTEAGYAPNEKQGRFADDLLLEALARLTRDLGHFPLATEIKLRAREDSSFPSHNTFRRFGGKAKLASALASWCEESGEWEDVFAVCAPLAEAASNEPEAAESEVVEGYVYLMRSGKFYKIGRSNAPGRREYELSIQLPEPIKTVHTIKTDDPAGIEGYWHRRFAERRKNGEWFELGRADVAAFKRRKFM